MARKGGRELLDDFYRVWSRRMGQLGTPAFPIAFFAEILRVFGDDAWIQVVEFEGRRVGGMLMLRHGERVYNPWAATSREYDDVSANNLLYWSAIRDACEAGVSEFDMGRSQRNSPTLSYKESWGATVNQLTYLVKPANRISVRSLAIGARIWSRMPAVATRRLGP